MATKIKAVVTKEKRNGYMAKYRASEKGKMSIKENSDRQSDKRRRVAAALKGVVVVKEGEVDAKEVQRALSVWGGWG